MYFVSFQPYDWRTAVKPGKKGDFYVDQLGFDPMYCSLAETLGAAAVNACFSDPTTPEVALWFRTGDWHLIDRVEHCRALAGGPAPRCLPRKGCAAYCAELGVAGSFTDFLVEMLPYGFEFLVDRDRVDPVAEVDIKAVVSRAFEEGGTHGASVQDAISDAVSRWRKSYGESGRPWMTQERAARDAEACMWWRWYCKDNDLFLDDCRRIIGDRRRQGRVSMRGVDAERMCRLKAAFDDDPCRRNFDRFVGYMESAIYPDGKG